ncbi:MAG TPA: hypothetical protein VD789_11745 [Thermomicrobiales bacterium]|nr:hypothetical protein [Thermomicrobiales bacterium]
MTTLFIDLILVFWLLLFGGMALLPFITGSTSSRRQSSRPAEDRVISIAPARPVSAPTPGRRTPLVPRRDDQHDRPAA